MRKTALGLMVAAGLLVAGCAHNGARPGPGEEVDGRYIHAVDNTARKHGAQVIWINPPTRKSQDNRGDAAES